MESSSISVRIIDQHKGNQKPYKCSSNCWIRLNWTLRVEMLKFGLNCECCVPLDWWPLVYWVALSCISKEKREMFPSPIRNSPFKSFNPSNPYFFLMHFTPSLFYNFFPFYPDIKFLPSCLFYGSYQMLLWFLSFFLFSLISLPKSIKVMNNSNTTTHSKCLVAIWPE